MKTTLIIISFVTKKSREKGKQCIMAKPMVKKKEIKKNSKHLGIHRF